MTPHPRLKAGSSWAALVRQHPRTTTRGFYKSPQLLNLAPCDTIIHEDVLFFVYLRSLTCRA